MSYNYTDSLEPLEPIDTAATRSIRSLYSGYPLGLSASSASLGANGGALLTKSASATNNNNSVTRIAQDLLELQRHSRKNLNYNQDLYSQNASFDRSFSINQAAQQYVSSILSEMESAILKSNNPIDINETEEITVNGHRGIWANKFESINWKGPIQLSDYEINEDPSPEIITKKTLHSLDYIQELAIRYLRPPTPPNPGEIIINQLANILTPPAPPLILRQQPARPATPEPLVVREAPPPPPPQVGRKIITISGKRVPPPPRKVIIERLAPLPSKPQSVIIERWLPYSQVKRKVIFNRTNQADPVVVKPKNIIVQWEAPQVQIKREFKYLGVLRANPFEYVQRFGNSLTLSHQLPDFVKDIKNPDGLILAANTRPTQFYELEGDLQALSLVDLEREGLSEYRNYVNNIGRLSPQRYSGTKLYSQSAAVFSNSATQSYLNDNSFQTQSTTSFPQTDNIETLIEYIFRSIDRNNNGRINVEDAEKILLRLNSRLDRKYGEDDVRAFFNALDINNDGTLDLREFKRAFLNLNNP